MSHTLPVASVNGWEKKQESRWQTFRVWEFLAWFY